jgi:hypothetical protein
MKQLFILLIIVLTISCNANEPSSKTNGTIKQELKAIKNNRLPDVICFSTTGKDTAILKINISENLASGTLIYKLFEKDSNKGKLEGKLYGDTLIANYKFMSEGVESLRQVAFLIKDSVATEGYGDVEEKDGKMVFKDWKSLDFKNGLILKKVDCK